MELHGEESGHLSSAHPGISDQVCPGMQWVPGGESGAGGGGDGDK